MLNLLVDSNVWRDYGVFWAFCAFNLAVVFFASWVYLQGGKKIKRWFSPAARRETKAIKEQENNAEGNKA